MRKIVVTTVLALALSGATSGTTALAATPTCSDVLSITVHGQHIIGDYITGIGHDVLPWPPSGGIVGQIIAGSGVVLAGGPGPGFHFPNGFAAGASFCVPQSQAPGFHVPE